MVNTATGFEHILPPDPKRFEASWFCLFGQRNKFKWWHSEDRVNLQQAMSIWNLPAGNCGYDEKYAPVQFAKNIQKSAQIYNVKSSSKQNL
jgi:hypothetical protein